MTISMISFWSNENRIIGSDGTKVDGREHCLTDQRTRPMSALPETSTPPVDLEAQLRELLLSLHGPLLGGAPLVTVLGPESSEIFA